MFKKEYKGRTDEKFMSFEKEVQDDVQKLVNDKLKKFNVQQTDVAVDTLISSAMCLLANACLMTKDTHLRNMTANHIGENLEKLSTKMYDGKILFKTEIVGF